jgi:hypothetical protein
MVAAERQCSCTCADSGDAASDARFRADEEEGFGFCPKVSAERLLEHFVALKGVTASGPGRAGPSHCVDPVIESRPFTAT